MEKSAWVRHGGETMTVENVIIKFTTVSQPLSCHWNTTYNNVPQHLEIYVLVIL